MPILELPIRLNSPNKKTHWAREYARNKRFKLYIRYKWNFHQKPPCIVTLTRIAPRQFDQDNLIAAFKPIRDAVADLLIPGLAPGQADSSDQIKWVYTQERGDPKQYLIRIEITPIPATSNADTP